MTQVLEAPAEARRRIYDDHGVIIVRNLLTAAEVAQIREVFTAEIGPSSPHFRLDALVAPDEPLARYPRMINPHRIPETEAGRLARRFLLDERITSIVSALIGDHLAAQSMFYFKPPGARGQAMHQDNFFLRAAPETCLAAWVAIDDTDAENGGLQVVPGSHTHEVVCPETADVSESFSPQIVPVPEGMEVHQTRLAAGDALFFHGSLLHGSRPNSSTDRFRRSLIFHYVPAGSVEIAAFYNPLVRPDGTDVDVTEAVGGGACGDPDVLDLPAP